MDQINNEIRKTNLIFGITSFVIPLKLNMSMTYLAQQINLNDDKSKSYTIFFKTLKTETLCEKDII